MEEQVNYRLNGAIIGEDYFGKGIEEIPVPVPRWVSSSSKTREMGRKLPPILLGLLNEKKFAVKKDAKSILERMTRNSPGYRSSLSKLVKESLAGPYTESINPAKSAIPVRIEKIFYQGNCLYFGIVNHKLVVYSAESVKDRYGNRERIMTGVYFVKEFHKDPRVTYAEYLKNITAKAMTELIERENKGALQTWPGQKAREAA